jgi:hypothetical protein
VKSTPEAYLDKIKLELNEDAQEDGNDVLTRVFAKVSGGLKKSETERLLDSQ